MIFTSDRLHITQPPHPLYVRHYLSILSTPITKDKEMFRIFHAFTITSWIFIAIFYCIVVACNWIKSGNKWTITAPVVAMDHYWLILGKCKLIFIFILIHWKLHIVNILINNFYFDLGGLQGFRNYVII